jgi:signal transduction histidine kinase
MTGEQVTTCVRHSLETGESQVLEQSDEQLAVPAGAHYFRSSYFPVVGSAGLPEGVGAVIVDVTAQKRAAQRAHFFADASDLLSRSLDLGTTLDSLAKLVVGHMADGCIVTIPREDGRFLRFSAGRDPDAEQLLRAQLAMLAQDAPVPPVRRVLETGQAQLIREMTPAHIEAAALNPAHKASIERFQAYSCMLVPLRARNRAIGVLSILSRNPKYLYGDDDLQMAQELADRAGLAVDNAHLFEEARRAARLREDMLAMVSHDLRSPLATIVFRVSGLRSEPSSTDEARMLGSLAVIERSCQGMLRLVNDLLDLGSIQSGRLTLERNPCRVDVLLREALELSTGPARAKNIHLHHHSAVFGTEVLCDRGRILQVLTNLLGNAIKFSPRGGAVALDAERIGDEIVCHVSDTGPGIRDEDLPHLFEQYWSGAPAGTAQNRAPQGEASSPGPPATRGTGLGLYISKGIVEAHGGRIRVKSRVGMGATFTISLPVAG